MIGIVGHRDGFFRELKNVHLGDPMDFCNEKGDSSYLADAIVLLVSPDDVAVLVSRSKPSLTLCRGGIYQGKFNHDKDNSKVEATRENSSKRPRRTVLFSAFANRLACCCSYATEA